MTRWLLLLLGCAACGDPTVDGLETRSLFSPLPGGVSDTQLRVPKGRALAFVAQPLHGSETLKLDIFFESQRPEIATAERTVEMNQFVLFGAEIGSTVLRVRDEHGRDSDVGLEVDVVSP